MVNTPEPVDIEVTQTKNKEKGAVQCTMEEDNTSLLGNPDGSHTHAGTNAHTGNTDLLVGTLELSQEGADLARASAAERMTEGDSTTLGVDLLSGQAKLVDAPHALGGKGLVDLEDVDLILGDAGLLESNGNGGPGTDTHQEGLDTDNAGGDVLADDLLAQTLGSGALHEQNGGSTVGDLGGVTGVDGAVLGKGRADLAEGLGGHALADTVISLDGDGLLLAGLGVGPLDLEGSNLLVEEAGLLGLDGLLVGGSSKSILGGTGDTTVLGHVLGQDTHGDLAVGGLGVVLEELRELGDGAGTIWKQILVTTLEIVIMGSRLVLTRTGRSCSQHQHRYQPRSCQT